MKKTTNYQLNQWDETDRILREDFNEDNAKIDAAIHAAAEKTVVLKEITTTVSANKVKIDFSDVDFCKYRELYVNLSTSSEDATNILVAFNNETTVKNVINYNSGGYMAASYGYVSTRPAGYYQAVCINRIRMDLNLSAVNCTCEYFLMHQSSSGIAISADARSIKGVSTVLTWPEVREMDFYTEYGSYNLLAGTKIRIVGVRR